MNNIQNVLYNLENDLYPYDPDNSWGVAVAIHQNIPLGVFNVSPTLCLKLVAVLQYHDLWNDDETPRPQVIINYVDGKWIVRLQSFNPLGDEIEEFCVTLTVSKIVVSTLLTAFVNNNIPVYDCMCELVL